MKRRYIIGIITIATIFIYGCHSGQQGHDHDHSSSESHEHCDGDGHNHEIAEIAEEHSDEISFTKEQAEAIGLETETVTAGVFTQVIKVSGQIQTPQGDEATVAATSNGIVSFVNPSITEGTAVKAGEALVSISAKNILEGDPVAKAKISYETAQKEFQRAEELVKDKIISVKEYEQIRLRYETAKTVYEAQSANVTANGVKVTSPINGFVKNRLIRQGDYVSVGQAIVTVAQNRRLQLRAEVPENYFKYLKNIGSANFKPAYDDTVYRLSDLNGRLLSFGKTAESESFYIPVTFEFDNVGDIIPGSYTEIYLLSVPLNDVISVPVSAITEEQDLFFVYLQLDEEGYKKQEITPGQSDGKRVAILSGLNAGDKVVTKGVYQVKLAATSSITPEGHSH
ncbi:MAG: efflux RND transporter periplasmic adaptor subunit [Prevotellaceae bacterium]|jgi:RND family efflux transporter MFP subunit|nr:efflux RND transporter periplasmic adaptor subunit [Prevotellaceae bacterium]